MLDHGLPGRPAESIGDPRSSSAVGTLGTGDIAGIASIVSWLVWSLFTPLANRK